MTGKKTHYEASLDRPIHTKRVRDDGTIEGHAIETHYAVAENCFIAKNEDWLSIIIDWQDIEIETRLPLDKLWELLNKYYDQMSSNLNVQEEK